MRGKRSREEEEEEETKEDKGVLAPHEAGWACALLASTRNGGRTATEIANDSINCFGQTTVRMSGRWRMVAMGMTSTSASER